MLSLELIDAELVLAKGQGDAAAIVAAEPGVALLEDAATVTGTEAARRVRRSPLLAQNNFWRGLSTQALMRPSRTVGTTADIAYAQASALLTPHKAAEPGVLLAVPAGYSREQLGLLLGVINETGVPVMGIVDAALAACSLEAAPARLLHLDIELHQAILTVLEFAGGERAGLKRNRYEIVARHGLLAIYQSWIQVIAEQFVLKTRFDPLHDANNEQRLVDELPRWLSDLNEREALTVSLEFEDRTLEIEVQRAQLIAAAEAHYAQLLRLVQDARVAGMPIELRLSARIAALPGFKDRLSTLRDCEIRVLPRGAGALGALRHEAAIRRPAESLALVYQLPVQRAASAAMPVADIAATPPQLRPTHVLYQGRAWAISEQPLKIGSSIGAGGARSLLLPSSLPGISRVHCSVVRRNGAVTLEDHSTYGSYVNEERVIGSAALTVGDRVRIGSPGVTLDLIQLVKDNGTPQD
jgi:hypothetical protein